MRAAVVPRIGGKWEVREVPTPEPSEFKEQDAHNKSYTYRRNLIASV